MKERFRAEFRRAFGEAVQSLGSRQRSAMRLHIADGVSLEVVAAAFGVHRATVVRWLATSKVTVLERTRQNLSKLLGQSEQEVDSILRAARSHIDVSLGSVLREISAAE